MHTFVVAQKPRPGQQWLPFYVRVHRRAASRTALLQTQEAAFRLDVQNYPALVALRELIPQKDRAKDSILRCELSATSGDSPQVLFIDQGYLSNCLVDSPLCALAFAFQSPNLDLMPLPLMIARLPG